MMRHKKQIDFTDKIVGTSKFEFFLLGEITEIQKTKMSIGEQYANRPGILCIVGGSGRLARTIRVGFARIRQWVLNDLSCCRKNSHLHPFDRKRPSWLHNDMRVTGDRLFIRRVIGARDVRILLVGAVIDKGPDLDAVSELRNSSNVIAVIVRDQNIVQLLQSSLVSRGDNAVRIASFVARPACVDEQRLPRWTHDERGLSALYVDEIHL